MISKELISEVLGYKVEEVKCEMNSKVYFNNSDNGDYINIYHLSHKCKEWAWNNKYKLVTEFMMDKTKVNIIHRNTAPIDKICNWKKCDTEPKAIFKACQWILENKDK